MKEEWRDIPGFEGLYQVSNLGNTRSVRRCVPSGRGHDKWIGGVTLKKRIIKSGSKLVYNSLCLWKQGKPYYRLLHRIVALTFIPNPENKTEVNHKDLNTRNNRVDNLEWVTTLENHRHSRISRTKGLEAKNVKLTKEAVFDIRSRASTYLEYMDKYGISQATVSCVQRGRTWRHI